MLRRASKLFNGRLYYRQLRRYEISGEHEPEVISRKTVMDVGITRIAADFNVYTTGYLEMGATNDLKNARLVDFSQDPQVDTFNRKYIRKTVLKISLPGSDEKIRFTICMLLQELLRSVIPDGWQYLAITSAVSKEIKGYLNYLIYGLSGAADPEYIYVFEDSEMDIGLLDVVEKNIIRLMELVTDFLAWHFEKMREPEMKDPEIHTVEFPPFDAKKRKKNIEKMQQIAKLSGAEKDEEIVVGSVEKAEAEAIRNEKAGNEAVAKSDPENRDESADNKDESVESKDYAEKHEDESWNPDDNQNPDYVAIDGTDIFDETTDDNDLFFDEVFETLGIVPLEKTRYQNECFMKYGFDEIDGRLKLEEVKQYLVVHGFYDNDFTKARKREKLEDNGLDLNVENHCDFCGMPLSGVSYEKLDDGRVRCGNCSATAITSLEDFTKLFSQTSQMMESFYEINYNVAIAVRMVDANKIARGYGSVFTPSTAPVARVVGYAERKRNKYQINIENGSPRLATIETTVHELTHIWQYINWKKADIDKLYDTKWKRDLVYEGMAIWASIQYLYMIGEESYASQREQIYMADDSAYGEGFKLYNEKYPLKKDHSILKHTPFKLYPPL